MKSLLQKNDGNNGRGKQNIWQLTWNSAGSKQDLAKHNEQSEKSGDRRGGWWCCVRATPTDLAGLEFGKQIQLVLHIATHRTWLKIMEWNKGEREEVERRWLQCWRWWLILSSIGSLRATEGKTTPSLPAFSISKIHCGATSLWGSKKNQKRWEKD